MSRLKFRRRERRELPGGVLRFLGAGGAGRTEWRSAWQRYVLDSGGQRALQRLVSVGQSASPPAAITWLPSSTAQVLSEPKSSRQPQDRRVKRCKMCSAVKPI